MELAYMKGMIDCERNKSTFNKIPINIEIRNVLCDSGYYRGSDWVVYYRMRS